MKFEFNKHFKRLTSSFIAILFVTLVVLSCQQMAHACCLGMKESQEGLKQSHCGESHPDQAEIAPCCIEQDDVSVLTFIPKKKLSDALPVSFSIELLTDSRLIAFETSLFDQAFLKDQSKRYLELRVFLN